MSGDRERCLSAGMDGYLAKPITEDQLNVEISRLQLAPLLADA
jgi:CheY-like chemotaxis protein